MPAFGLFTLVQGTGICVRRCVAMTVVGIPFIFAQGWLCGTGVAIVVVLSFRLPMAEVDGRIMEGSFRRS